MHRIFFGIGLREMIADEMTNELRTIRDVCGLVTTITGMSITLPLTSKGVSFGWIKSLADGGWDTSQVQGVNADLRVRPFFHDGREFPLRAFAVGAFNDEMGLQAADPLLCAANDAASPAAVTTPPASCSIRSSTRSRPRRPARAAMMRTRTASPTRSIRRCSITWSSIF